ncbi:MAG: ABC transporter permease [bacterium]|nr:ABC transporter permease [bacterium]
MKTQDTLQKLRESLTIALDIIRTHKMRSFLTLLGIIIGVMAIIGMQSLIEGLQKDMQRQMEQLGSNVFQVQKFPAMEHREHGGDNPYRNRKDITLVEAAAIEEHCDLVTNVGPEAWQFGVTVKFADRKTSPTVQMGGGVPAFFPNNGYFIQDGRAVTDMDVQGVRSVAVLGQDIAEELFPFRNPVGESVIVDGRRYDVIGVLEKLGQSFGRSRDNIVIVPLTTLMKYYGKERSLNITIQAKDATRIEEAKEQVIGVLRAVRKVEPGRENDFEIWSSATLVDSFNNMTRAIRIGAIVVVSFSLLVAGIGIMNIMLVSITERIREIGIRMAVGANRRDIMMQFLVEAVLLSEVGGIIGILAGIGIGQLVALVSPVPASVPVPWMLIGFFFCSLVGLGFGLYPAQKAAKLDPISALRYE